MPLSIVLDAAQPKTLSQQIFEQIRQAILERRLAPGARLPSSRVLSGELGCARGTVLTAVDQLIAEGYLVTRSASGVTVAAGLPDEMLVAPALGSQAAAKLPSAMLPRRTLDVLAAVPAVDVPLAPRAAFPIGQPDRHAFPFPLWAKLLEQEWRKPAWHLAGATHPFGHPGLRAAIAAYLGTARGFMCDPAAIVITSGVRQSVSLFARLALESGETAWIEEPGYPGMTEALAESDVRAVSVPIDASGFSLDAAAALAPGSRLAIVTPSHQFPLGTVLTLQRRLALLSWAERTKGWIAEDDFDGEYRYAGRPLAPMRALDRSGRVAYLGSFSKLLFPALRLSYLVLPHALAGAAEAIMNASSTPAPLLGQGALARFIAEGHLATHLRRTRPLYANRQQGLIDAAGRHLGGLLEVAPDDGGMHLVARPVASLLPCFDDRAGVAGAAAAGVVVSALSRCYVRPEKVHGFLLGYAGTPQDDIEPAVIRLRGVVQGLAKNLHTP